MTEEAYHWEGRVGKVPVDQREQGRKATEERGVCSPADRSWPWRGWPKEDPLFPLLSQMLTSAVPAAFERMFVFGGRSWAQVESFSDTDAAV